MTKRVTIKSKQHVTIKRCTIYFWYCSYYFQALIMSVLLTLSGCLMTKWHAFKTSNSC